MSSPSLFDDGIDYSAAEADDTDDLECAPPDETPANPNATAEAAAVLKYLASLTRGPYRGTIAAQFCYHGTESFEQLVGKLHNDTGKWIGIEYECGPIFTLQQFLEANQVIIDYWNAGGIVWVTWCPISPWLNDESDIVNHPGGWQDAFYTPDVNMRLFLDDSSPQHAVWMKKLDRVAATLTDLRDAGVAVLWRPLQECTGGWYWYGSRSHMNDPAPYIDLWRHMFRYFTDVKKLNNLLWVYAPAAWGHSTVAFRQPVDWVYPGADYVDIVAGTVFNYGLWIVDYRRYLEFGKPLGISEYGIDSWQTYTATFDNLLYLDRLKNRYPRMAFWMSPGNWQTWETDHLETVYYAIAWNRHAYELMNDPSIITRESLDWRSFLAGP